MRNLVFMVIIFFTSSVQANTLNCINISSDLSLMETLTESGEYRELAKTKTAKTFDYSKNAPYNDYLVYAQTKVKTNNPKASMYCPIDSIVTRTKNISKSDIVVSDLISPFELTAQNSKQGILLIHGLTDSPYVFHDLAAYFHSKNITVRTLLLPGHGTAAEALIDVDYQDWQQATQYAINKMYDDFENVYVGGFSTGGALVLDNLLTSPKNIDKLRGVMLWAPASKAQSPVAWAAKFVDLLPFLDYSEKSADVDFAKYESFPLNAGAQVHALMNELQDKLNQTTSLPDVPLFIVNSQVDATIDSQATLNILNTWHNAANRQTQQLDTLFYFGDATSLSDLPESIHQILPVCTNKPYCNYMIDVAHTAMTAAPANPHYGWQGNYRHCESHVGSKNYLTCKTANEVVLGETTTKNLNKYPSLQRITFNPAFEEMQTAITEFIAKTQKVY